MEISKESDRNTGLGTCLVRAAVSRIPSDEAILASVARETLDRSAACSMPGSAQSGRSASFIPKGNNTAPGQTRVSLPDDFLEHYPFLVRNSLSVASVGKKCI